MNQLFDIEARDAAVEEIAARVGVRAARGRRFAELTSLKVGGAIDWVLMPETESQAAALTGELDRAGIGWRVLGAGSNVLADDAPHHYVVVSMREVKGEVTFDGERVTVSAGYSLPRLWYTRARQFPAHRTAASARSPSFRRAISSAWRRH